MGEDFICQYEPQGNAVIQPLPEQTNALMWTGKAEQRISRAPRFLRKMIRKRAENYAREQGRNQVTAEDLTTLAEKRFGKGKSFKPNFGGKSEAANHEL